MHTKEPKTEKNKAAVHLKNTKLSSITSFLLKDNLCLNDSLFTSFTTTSFFAF